MKNYYIIDFDSTFTQVEALDELARISLEGSPDQEKVYKEIERFTNLAMEGKISFREALAGRIALLRANKEHLQKLIKHLKKKVSKSFDRNREFFKQNSETAWIVSGGFKEFIIPVVSPYGILEENIYANTFKFDENGYIVGYDDTNPLSNEGGKVQLLKDLNIQGTIYGIGDGYSDFQLKESGLIEKFFAFTENISRKSVTDNADHVTPSFDEFLYVNQLPSAISYPKNRILCLIVGDDVPEISAHILKRDGFSIRVEDTFEEKYTKDVGMLLLGNGVQVSNEQLSRADKLKTLGYLGDVKGNVSRTLCTQKGIVIFDDKKEKHTNAEFVPRRMADFINNGDTDQSRNFPHLILPKKLKGHRLLHIHKNVPGILARINNIYADNQINILSQFLMTRGDLGYVVTDIDSNYDKKLITQLKKIENTIKFRILYKQ